MELLDQNLTDSIIKTFYEVYNELGHGFFRKSVSEFNVFRIKK